MLRDEKLKSKPLNKNRYFHDLNQDEYFYLFLNL